MPTAQDESTRLQQTSLWTFDMPHMGYLCQRVREARRLNAEDIAKWAEVDNATISREIERNGMGGHKSFKKYVEALQANHINGKPVYTPISKAHAKLLTALHNARELTMKRQCEFAGADLTEIMSPSTSPALKELIEALRSEQRPAHIMDSLWFIHAINGAAFKLFDISSKASYLYDWKAWHVVASKFWREHPVRQKHHSVEEFFPPTIDILFKYEKTYPYLFTWQMRNLLKRLSEVSEESGFEFTRWWLQATSFNLSYSMNTSIRTIHYNGQPIQVEAMVRPQPDMRFDQTGYTLTVWNPFGRAAFEAFNDIYRDPLSKEIYFAATYDHQKNFHVNTWPEVQSAIKLWSKDGYL